MGETLQPVTWQALYVRLKQVIAEKRDWDDWTRVKSDMVLTDPPLLFEPASKKNLTKPINKEFEAELQEELTREEVGDAEKVQDLARLVYDKLKPALQG